jgi:probable poly-beta-1,6-N-acetyl-D-glucosamine export protein
MLSGLAIIAVAINHATNWGYIAMFWWTDQYLPVTVPNYDQMGSFSYYLLVIAQKLSVFCVPAFLFVTGMFLAYAARGSQSHLTWETVRRRIFNLLPPYLLWIIIMYIAQYFMDEKRTVLQYLWGLISIEDSPFFFVPLIIVYYLISPFLVELARQRMKLLLSIGIAVLVMGIVRGYLGIALHYYQVEGSILNQLTPFLRQEKIFEYFFYYVFGMIAGFYQAPIKAWIIRFRWILLAAAVVSGILAVLESEWVFQTMNIVWRSRTLTLPTAIYSIAMILCFWAFEQVKIPFSGLLYRLGTDTLGIYLIHQIIMLVVPKVIYHVLPILMGYQILYQPVLVISAVGIPILMMNITRKLPIRVYYRYIFG